MPHDAEAYDGDGFGGAVTAKGAAAAAEASGAGSDPAGVALGKRKRARSVGPPASLSGRGNAPAASVRRRPARLLWRRVYRDVANDSDVLT